MASPSVQQDTVEENNSLWAGGDSTVGKVLALHVADPGLTPGLPYGPLSTSRSNLCASMGVTQASKKKKNYA